MPLHLAGYTAKLAVRDARHADVIAMLLMIDN